MRERQKLTTPILLCILREEETIDNSDLGVSTSEAGQGDFQSSLRVLETFLEASRPLPPPLKELRKSERMS